MNSVRALPLLDSEQWKYFTELDAFARAQGLVVMPGVPLAEWLYPVAESVKRLPGLVAMVSAKMLPWRRSLEVHIYHSSVLFSLVDARFGGAICLAICDDLVSEYALKEMGISTRSWSDVQARELVPASLAREAKVAFDKGHQIRWRRHEHHEVIVALMAETLQLAWPQSIESTELSSDEVKIVERGLSERRSTLLLAREVALSRFVPELAANSSLERSMRETSSVDFLIYARPPLNLPLLVIEYDGKEHRTDERKIAKDLAKDAMLIGIGLPILRIGSDTAPAQFFPNRSNEVNVHPRLPMLIRVAEVISALELRNKLREPDRMKLLAAQISSVSVGRYCKSADKLDGRQLEFVLSESFRRDRESQIELGEADGWNHDIDEANLYSLKGLLGLAGLSEDAIEDFAIFDVISGREARGKLRLSRGAQVSLRTPSLRLMAPGLTEADCIRLVDIQLTETLVDDAEKIMRRHAAN